MKANEFIKTLKEDATGMGAASVAAVVTPLGGKAKNLKEKTTEYSNVIKRGGPVKVKK